MLELIKIIMGLFMFGIIVTASATMILLWWKFIMYPILTWIFPEIKTW